MANVNMYDCDYTNPPAQDGGQCLLQRNKKKVLKSIYLFYLFLV